MSLSNLYSNHDLSAAMHTQYYVEGAITGACACPEIPLPDEWLPWVIKHHKQIQNVQQADLITDALLGYFKSQLSLMNSEKLVWPQYASYTLNVEYLSEYCKGLIFAHYARESFWQNAWNKMQDQAPQEAPQMASDLKHCLLMFSTFSDPQKAINEDKALPKEERKDLGDKLPLIANSLPQALDTYIKLSGRLAAFLPNQFEVYQK